MFSPGQESTDGKPTRYVMDYRHIIHALIRKPRAFRFCQYQNEILPNETYCHIWRHLDTIMSREVAPKSILRLLKLAADYDCEEQLGQHVQSLIEHQKPIDIGLIENLFNGGAILDYPNWTTNSTR